jgi:two-component sensor histidine kinase
VATAFIDGIRPSAPGDEPLLLGTVHRCSKNLQPVVSLLGLQSRRAANPDVVQALTDAMGRVGVLARARRLMHDGKPQSFGSAL